MDSANRSHFICVYQEQINAETHDDYVAQMERFSTFFGLEFSHLIFSGTEQLSLSLQGKNTTVHFFGMEFSQGLSSYLFHCKARTLLSRRLFQLVNWAIKFLENLRSDVIFDQFTLELLKGLLPYQE